MKKEEEKEVREKREEEVGGGKGEEGGGGGGGGGGGKKGRGEVEGLVSKTFCSLKVFNLTSPARNFSLLFLSLVLSK